MLLQDTREAEIGVFTLFLLFLDASNVEVCSGGVCSQCRYSITLLNIYPKDRKRVELVDMYH